jgi:hypothetical protein
MLDRNATQQRIERIARTRAIVQHMIADASIPEYRALAHTATEHMAIVHTDSVMVARYLALFIEHCAPSWYTEYRSGDHTTVYVAQRAPLD